MRHRADAGTTRAYILVSFSALRKSYAKMCSKPFYFSHLCFLCHKSVELETSNADEDGNAVHEDCYFLKLKARLRESPQQLPDNLFGIIKKCLDAQARVISRRACFE